MDPYHHHHPHHYPQHQQSQPQPQPQPQSHNNHHMRPYYQPLPPLTSTTTNVRPELHQKCNRGSHSSDTSSAYSGSDTMASIYGSSMEGDEIDFSGLVESTADSDEEDLAESMDSLNVRDAVRDCLEKDPSERTEDDVEVLLEFTQGLKAFTNITLAVRRALCSVMVFAVVDKAGTVVMSDGEELDSWSVLINGAVEIEHRNGEREELQMGDSFGILPTMDKLYHKGVMRTKCDDCQFVCITQTDYYRIQHQGEENTKRHEDEDGRVIMVTELRQIGGTETAGSSSISSSNSTATSNAKRGHVVIRGTPERLLQQLVEENSMTDPFYVEDFLLTHRIFINNSREVIEKLLSWFEADINAPKETMPKFTCHANSQEIRDRVTRVVLLWVNNHFTDFEADHELMEFLEIFESGLEHKKLLSQLRLLHIACAAKARMRSCILTRSSRDECLNFKIIGGWEMRGACLSTGGCGIYISHVEGNSKAQEAGLKRGDQIHEVNGQSFEHVTSKRALEILKSSTHLSITVKSNLLGFKEMMQAIDLNSNDIGSNNYSSGGIIAKNIGSPRRICASDVAKLHGRSDSTCDNFINSNNRSHMLRLSSVDMLLSSSGGNCGEDQVDRCLPAAPATPMQTASNMASNFMNNLLQSVNASGKKDGSGLHGSSNDNKNGGFMTLAPKRRLQKALAKMNLLNKNIITNLNDSSDALLNVGVREKVSHKTGSFSSASSISAVGSGTRLYQSQSNPDLTSSSQCYEDRNITPTGNIPPLGNYLSSSMYRPSAASVTNSVLPDYPEHVLKVYKADQTCKYLPINKETTAHEVVMLALQEFGIHDPSSNFSLCEVSVGEGGMVKQRRLPDQMQNLAERITFASRYYLKTNGITETLVPDDLALELVRELNVHFLQLNAYEIAIQLTLQDFSIFRQIESTEYVDDLFGLKTKYGVPMLSKFSELVNREMFWVVTEICSEHNIVRRMKIVKQFIKIARHCKECRNFNSMFAIISGLGHAAVSRLRQTWEKVPSKYQRLFTDLQDLMDPSRNMSKYRQLVSSELLNQHPIIPFYPIVRKDLTFIHLGNDTWVDGLINFEKLRMIAKEVRVLTHMCSSPYDLLAILELKGQSPSNAMFSLNQMSTSQGGITTGHQGPTLIAANAGQSTIKRRKKSSAVPNSKKMFEEAQMVRRVKAYLNNLKIQHDEDILHKLSLECEPSQSVNNTNSYQQQGSYTSRSTGGGSSGVGGSDQLSIYSHNSNSSSAPNSSLSLRKRHPSSPTLSTTSSTSSTSDNRRHINANCPKFGTASPQAVRKILSLSESTKIRPHQSYHRPPAILPTNLPLLNNNSHHLHGHTFSTTAGMVLASSTPSPSPCSHRRLASGSSNSMPANMVPIRSIHERSQSDTSTPAPLPSVDLNLESSSVTTFRDLPLRKSITSGSVSSNDSGHGSYAQHDTSTSSVYTAADCRLLQQISNTATRNATVQCNNTRPGNTHLQPSPHLLTQISTINVPPTLPSICTASLSGINTITNPTPPPPPIPSSSYLMRTQNIQLYQANAITNGPNVNTSISTGSVRTAGTLAPPTSLLPNMPPPYATAAALLHHNNHRHSNLHGTSGCPMCPPKPPTASSTTAPHNIN